jgi:MSHA biogenesis protein MshO
MLVAILAALAARNITPPIEAMVASGQRARLVNAADTALARMGREISIALPNSVRVQTVGTTVLIEFARAVYGGRYRANPTSTGTGTPLSFTASSGSFDVLGGDFSPVVTSLTAAAAATQANCATASTAANCLVVYNTGQTSANFYNLDNVAGLTAPLPPTSPITTLSFNRAPATTPFPYPSPLQRFFVVDTPVSFVCDPTAGTLRRYAYYPVQLAQPNATWLAANAASNKLLADGVSNCAFAYNATVGADFGLVSLSLQLASAGTPGQAVDPLALMTQIQVRNGP